MQLGGNVYKRQHTTTTTTTSSTSTFTTTITTTIDNTTASNNHNYFFLRWLIQGPSTRWCQRSESERRAVKVSSFTFNTRTFGTVIYRITVSLFCFWQTSCGAIAADCKGLS